MLSIKCPLRSACGTPADSQSRARTRKRSNISLYCTRLARPEMSCVTKLMDFATLCRVPDLRRT